MNHTPKLSIAILTYNRADALEQALRVIRDNTANLPDNIIEVVISDNASDDRTPEMVGRFKGLNISYFRNEENVGASENVLLACARSTGQYVLLHADDDLICPGALNVIVDTLNTYPGIGVLSSSLEAFHEDNPDQSLPKLRFPSSADQMYLKQGGEVFEKLFLRACNLSGLVIRRDLLDIEGARMSLDSLYPQIYLMGAACKGGDGVYLSKPLMKLRLEEVRRWQYAPDFMSRAIFSILKTLVKNEAWGPKAKQKIVKRRILAAYGPLFSSKQESWKLFFKTSKGLSVVKEYRYSMLFWGMVAGIGVIGCNGIGFIRKIWSGPTGADTISQKKTQYDR